MYKICMHKYINAYIHTYTHTTYLRHLVCVSVYERDYIMIWYSACLKKNLKKMHALSEPAKKATKQRMRALNWFKAAA